MSNPKDPKGEKPPAVSFDELLGRAGKAKPKEETGGKKFDPEKEGVDWPTDNDKVAEA